MKDLTEKIVLSKIDRYSEDFRQSSSTSGHQVKDLELGSIFGNVRFKEVVSPDGIKKPLEISSQLDHGLGVIGISSVDTFVLDGEGSLIEARGKKGPAKIADKVRVLARIAFGKPTK